MNAQFEDYTTDHGKRAPSTPIMLGIFALLAAIAGFGIIISQSMPHIDDKTTVEYSVAGEDADKPASEYAEEIDGIVTYGDGERSGHWPTVMHHFKQNEKWVRHNPAKSFDESMDTRDGQWKVVNDGVDRSSCRCCGSTENLNVHHIRPFHIDPNLQLDFDNLVTLCRDHHFHIGHHDNWKNANPNVCSDCDAMRRKLNPNRK